VTIRRESLGDTPHVLENGGRIHWCPT
jgi:hypothetical protein